ncbi:MAG: AAA family ATPase [[Ruminococcus] gnavus]|nr:AAA family ATPase [Mediterraneibacter gnavus]
MDKYEYKLKTEQMLKLMENGAYNRAAEIADSIDWKRVRNTNMLVNVSSLYEKIRDYRKSFGVLRAAYQRTEGSRKLLYRLCTLAIKTGNMDEAIDYYDEFMQAAPKDPNQYILRYRLLRAKRAPIEQQIHALEKFKKAEYVEEWAFELAKRYEEAGLIAECLEECDDLILWFSEGKYVYKAMDLKMKYKPLTPLQQEKYEKQFETEKNSENPEEKLIDLGKIKAESEEKRRREEEEAVRTTEDAVERLEFVPEIRQIELSEEEAAEQIRQAEPAKKKKLGDTMKLGEALQSLFQAEQSAEEEEIEELELSEDEAEEYEEELIEDADDPEETLEDAEDEYADLEEAMKEIEELSDLALLDEINEEIQSEETAEPTEIIAEETIETKVKEVHPEDFEIIEEPESVEEAEVIEEPESIEEAEVIEEPEIAEEAEMENMEKESMKLEESEIREEEEMDDLFSIDDILAEWDAADGGVEPEAEPEVDEEDVEQIERKPKSPILSPDIQRMIDEIEGVIPEEEELTLDVDSAEDYEEFLSEEEAEELEEEFEEELEEYDDYESVAAELKEEFKPTLSNEPDDREIPDEEESSDLLSSTAPLSRKETAKLIATGKTAPLPMDEIADALSISDTGFLVHSRYDLSGQGAKKAGLTEEQKKLFSYFVPVRGMSEQLVDVLEQDRNCTNRQGTSNTGNLLIIGNKGNGKTVLAVDVVKAIQKQRKIRQGRVAIITGEALNKKKISDIIAKLYGGALIIEKAGKLSERTVAKLNKAMEKDTGEMLIVLEEQRKPLDRLLSSNREFRKKFTSRLEVPIFVNDELVTFGQTYAQENGYRIDEMGILALYSRIDALQREDHAVTVAEVKDIMDEAMAHSQKVSAKKLVKRVLGKNTDDADRIILTEKDFNI